MSIINHEALFDPHFFSFHNGTYLYRNVSQTNDTSGFPILMYHDISNKKSRFSVRPEVFKKHLQALYDAGFVTAKLSDVLAGNTLGKKVVVLRFDDSRKNQFRVQIQQNGNLIIDPHCGVSLLLEFARSNPRFNHHALFCVVAHELFHQRIYVQYNLQYLLNNGMEIANHTLDHKSLLDATPEEIDHDFGAAMEVLEKLIGPQIQEIIYIAPPCGIRPRSARSQQRMKHFQWKGKHYSLKVFFAQEDATTPIALYHTHLNSILLKYPVLILQKITLIVF